MATGEESFKRKRMEENDLEKKLSDRMEEQNSFLVKGLEGIAKMVQNFSSSNQQPQLNHHQTQFHQRQPYVQGVPMIPAAGRAQRDQQGLLGVQHQHGPGNPHQGPHIIHQLSAQQGLPGPQMSLQKNVWTPQNTMEVAPSHIQVDPTASLWTGFSAMGQGGGGGNMM